jgi:surface carbohydrate biosynthesis protein
MINSNKKNAKPVILLSIETKARELPGKVLLASFLSEKGFKVILTNLRKIPFALKANAWLYIDRNSFAPRMSFFRRLKFLGFKLVCIDEEGIIWLTPELYKKRIHIKANSYVDMYFTWGKKQAELIKEVSSSINTILTGNPRVDLLRPELKAVYSVRADSIRSKYGEFILFVSNFSTNNNFYSKDADVSVIDMLVDDNRRQGLMDSQEEENDFRNFYNNRERVFEKIIELIRRLSREYPEKNIVVRPHPSENHDTWKELMKDYPNIKVIYEGELTPWIIAAKAVIHNSCTTGVEAALLNIKSIAYVPIDEPEFEMELPNSVSEAVSTENDVINLINQFPEYQEVPQILKEYISSITGSLACEKIAEQIDCLYQNRTSIEILKRKYFFRDNLLTRLISLYLSGFYKIINILSGERNIKKLKKFTDYKKQKLEQITPEECNALIKEYSGLLERFYGIKAEDVKGYLEISSAE